MKRKAVREKRKFPRLAIIFFIFFIVCVLGYAFLTLVQESYNRNVLGISTSFCGNKFDLNCDSALNVKDFGAVLALAKTATTQTPSAVCGNGVCEGGETSKSCSHDCGTTITVTSTSTPRVKTTTTSAPTQAPGQTATPTPVGTAQPSGNAPYPGAPPCSASAHTFSKIHGLWDPALRCHYDHEHGHNPFTTEVSALFPGFNLLALTGGVGVGHTNLSSPMENTHKHGGFKWQVTLRHPQGCAGFEGSTNGVNGSVIQYHSFGNYAIEADTRTHTAMALLRLCNSNNPNDFGYIYTTQFQDYGQRVVPYQGEVYPYPDSPLPRYNGGLGPYLTIDCVGVVPGNERRCRPSREYVVSRRLPANSNWSSKPTGRSGVVGSKLFQLFFRVRDTYQLIDWFDRTHPFTFQWICSSDGGLTYNPAGCRYNNTTTQVHEVAGEIPAAWDNLLGFDSDLRPGRITATGYTTRHGTLNRNCSGVSTDCHPIKMVNAFVGKYGSLLFYTDGKGQNLTPLYPERDIYFCNGTVCRDTDSGAVPSGWVGQNN